MSSPSSPEFSVVVCSYNRADSLKTTLQSVVVQETNGRPYEVVVVDNASTDHTKDVVQEIADGSTCEVRYVHEGQPGVSFARNTGVRQARGAWIAFIDDDERAEPDWLVNLHAAAVEQQVKCVGGAIDVVFEGESAQKRDLKTWVRIMFGSTADMPDGVFFHRRNTPGAGCLLVHREVFDKVGLFRTDLVEGGEDSELFGRMLTAGYRGYYTPDAMIHHYVPEFRLEPKYMRSASLRMGSHIARREHGDTHWLVFPFVILQRLIQLVVVHGSRLVLAWLKGEPENLLEKRCRWWMGQGYLQAALRFMFLGKDSTSSLEFRSERKPSDAK